MKEPTDVGATGWPVAVSVSASLSMLLETHNRGRMGWPRVAGSTSRASSGMRPGSTSATARRPPPARRPLPSASGSASRSSSPQLIVERQDPLTATRRSDRPTQRFAPRPPQTTAARFVELAPDRVPAISDGVFVDHAPRVRLFVETRNPSKPSHTDAHRARFDYCSECPNYRRWRRRKVAFYLSPILRQRAKNIGSFR